jgi:ABC-type polysaccharide/polyol phosphate transport system ATPase subunit
VSDPAAIELRGVSVRYRLPRERVASLKEFAIRWAQGRVEYVDLWALTGVSLEVRPGEILGVIGRNGAGKSTLLKTMARVLHPTSGRVIVRGRVAALLDLGAGFHAELTGRENVYLYGTLLGHTHAEVDAVLDDVVGFAEIEAFIDAPLRTYSTGMVARLGFAVATCRFAEVLLIDEVLAVGDASFQEKCLRRMDDYRRRGAAMVFVSHSARTVEVTCDRVLWLDHGLARGQGLPARVVSDYLADT